jgi:hypothetical protein
MQLVAVGNEQIPEGNMRGTGPVVKKMVRSGESRIRLEIPHGQVEASEHGGAAEHKGIQW